MQNKVFLIGRIGQPPETRHLESGNSVTRVSLATSEKYTDKAGNKQENTEWHNVVLWGRLGEIVQQYTKKGDLLSVEGRIKSRKHEDKRYTDIIASNVNLIQPKRDNASDFPTEEPAPQFSGAQTTAAEALPTGPLTDEKKLPF